MSDKPWRDDLGDIADNEFPDEKFEEENSKKEKTEVNREFIKAMQSDLDRKAPEYDGKDNPKNYKNIEISYFVGRVTGNLDKLITNIYQDSPDTVRQQCIEVANFCWMLWEKVR